MEKFTTLREEFESETGAHAFADQQYIEWLEELVEKQRQVKNCYIPDVRLSLPDSEKITEAAMEYAEIDGTTDDYDESVRDAAHFVAGATWYHKRIKGNGA